MVCATRENEEKATAYQRATSIAYRRKKGGKFSLDA